MTDSRWSSSSYLVHAYFQCADLRDTNFSGANLTGADLRGANLDGANFEGAVLNGVKTDGAFIINGAGGRASNRFMESS